MSVLVILWVIFVHWFADFVCQTHWQASNKSKNWLALYRHVTNYTFITALFLIWIFPLALDFKRDWVPIGLFLLITFTCHFLTDAVTSRITARLYTRQDWHDFFVVVGFDQFLHYAQLFLTIAWLQSA